ncbi:MAG: 50S ribosomal protein L6 [Chloroflexi bacterium]|nr:50S ribosomal protein L6 [Chloroflexota bacterium]
MSRIGRQPVPIPKGVQVTIEGNRLIAKGPKGELARDLPEPIQVRVEGDQIVVTRPSDDRVHRSLHGLTRALVANMITGVHEGFTRRMEIEGVGWRAEAQGQNLVLMVGYSHPVEIVPPPGITFQVDKGGRTFSIFGIDKELVGEIAARIRRVRPPEPYKGKGIRYEGEKIRRKAGKTGK